jgi:hypothetical protein
MLSRFSLALLSAIVVPTLSATAAVTTVNYTVDAGGNIPGPLNGLRAQASFENSGKDLIVRLTNTSTGVPAGFGVGESFLVSVGFNLPADVSIATAKTALIAPGSFGVASWSGRLAGASVAEEWLWTNDFGGDLMNSGQVNSARQVISTSSGQGGGTSERFDGGTGTVNGPSGGIVAAPPIVSLPGSSMGVSNSIIFAVTLTRALTDAENNSVAQGSLVEYGSDARYLRVPAPSSSLALIGAALIMGRRRRS